MVYYTLLKIDLITIHFLRKKYDVDIMAPSELEN